ncbi:Protein of unknown function [Gryllus bimaculatus]|nr:Protein of unknown function [Gryllus bimaculatus]
MHETNEVETCWTTLVVLVAVQLTAGIAWAALLTHGIAYLDDNVDSEDSPALLGGVLGADRLGPPIGQVLAFVCASRTGDVTAGGEVSKIWWLGLFSTVKRLLKNPIVGLLTLFLMFLYAPLHFFSQYENRYLESVYFIPEPEYSGGVFKDQWTSRVTTAFLKPPIILMTMLLSGMIIARKRPRPSSLAMWNVVVASLTAATFFTFIFLSCPVHITGMTDGKYVAFGIIFRHTVGRSMLTHGLRVPNVQELPIGLRKYLVLIFFKK